MTKPIPDTPLHDSEELRNEIEGALSVHMVQASDNGLRWAVDNIERLIAADRQALLEKVLEAIIDDKQKPGYETDRKVDHDCPACRNGAKAELRSVIIKMKGEHLDQLNKKGSDE